MILGSHVSVFPILNFVVYVTTLDQSPLYILDDNVKRTDAIFQCEPISNI